MKLRKTNKKRYTVYKTAWHVAATRDSGNSYMTLVAKPEGKRPIGRPRCGWHNTIKMDFREVGWEVQPEFMCLRIGT
jgi:hypothetical protein